MQPPYPPTVWALGGAPVKNVDIPIQAVFMVMFMVSGAVHMKIFRKTEREDTSFLISLFFVCSPNQRC